VQTTVMPVVPEVPSWYPVWARKLAEYYFSGSACLFLLHGNVHDLVYCARGPGDEDFLSLSEFLVSQMFGSWDVVLAYDLGRGLRPLAGAAPERLQSMMRCLAQYIGSPASWPRDPDQVLDTLERLIQRNLLEENDAQRKSIALVFDHAQYLIPAGDLSMLARGQASHLVRLAARAQNPYIGRVNMAISLVVDRLSEVNERLVHRDWRRRCKSWPPCSNARMRPFCPHDGEKKSRHPTAE
jgi:hypothetical protein